MTLTPEDVMRIWDALGGVGHPRAPIDVVRRAEVIGEQLAVAKRAGVECTGVTAKWCPRCGNCACPPLREGGDPCDVTMDDPACPLHAPESSHGEGEFAEREPDF